VCGLLWCASGVSDIRGGYTEKAAAEPPHSKGSWRIGWVSFYKTPHSAERRRMGHPFRNITWRNR
jgi:hypothetical protein